MWLIEAPAGNYIELYLYTFNLEYGGSNCPYDYLEIYDGRTSSSPLITRLCGSLPYTYMYSSGRFLFVRFRSDGSVRMPGFAAGCYATPGSKRNTLSVIKLSLKIKPMRLDTGPYRLKCELRATNLTASMKSSVDIQF